MAAVAVSRLEKGRLADAVLRRGRWRRHWIGSVSGCALTAGFADIARCEPVRMPVTIRWSRDRKGSRFADCGRCIRTECSCEYVGFYQVDLCISLSFGYPDEHFKFHCYKYYVL